VSASGRKLIRMPFICHATPQPIRSGMPEGPQSKTGHDWPRQGPHRSVTIRDLRNNHIAAVLMLVAASMAGVAATGTLPVVYVALGLVSTGAALAFALRGRFGAR
jgi:hypothetical protein